MEIFLSIVAIIFILYLCYVISKYLSKRAVSISQSTNIKVIERVVLAQDKYLMVAKVCNQYFLMAVTGQRVDILKELNEADLQLPPEGSLSNFTEIFQVAVDKIKNNKKFGDSNGKM